MHMYLYCDTPMAENGFLDAEILSEIFTPCPVTCANRYSRLRWHGALGRRPARTHIHQQRRRCVEGSPTGTVKSAGPTSAGQGRASAWPGMVLKRSIKSFAHAHRHQPSVGAHCHPTKTGAEAPICALPALRRIRLTYPCGAWRPYPRAPGPQAQGWPAPVREQGQSKARLPAEPPPERYRNWLR